MCVLEGIVEESNALTHSIWHLTTPEVTAKCGMLQRADRIGRIPWN